METNNLDTILKESLKEEFSPSIKLDMETQRKIRKVAQKKEFRFVNVLSTLSIILLAIEILLIFPQLQTPSSQTVFLIVNIDIFILLVFLLIFNYKNRKESIL